MVVFLRRDWSRHSKLGKGKKKKQVWKKPKGRDNKMREKRRGYPAIVSIGYRKDKKERKEIEVVRNIKDLENASKNKIIVIGKVGKKKKMEMVKKANEMKIIIQNINLKKFLKENEKEKKKNESK